MTKYFVDIGYWERGRTIEVVATSITDALEKAAWKIEKDDFDPALGAPYVVQIMDEKRKILWNYINGKLG